MDLSAYISSGVLENYLLGIATEQERKEVECMSHIYPEIKEELTSLQFTLESFAWVYSIPPPKELKLKIAAVIDKTEQDDGNESLALKVIRDNSLKIQKSSAYWKVAVAASLLLLFGTAFMLVQKLNESKNLSNKLVNLSNINSQLALKAEKLMVELTARETTLDEVRETYSLLASKETELIRMEGTEKNPESSVKIYVNSDKRKTILKVDYLPEISEDQQYQLWAIVDGVPQDMGVFEIDPKSEEIIPIPFFIDNPQAFAITLEKRGGNSTPTLSEMYVLGKV